MIYGLVDFVHHFLADTGNFHQLFRRHTRKLFERSDARGFDFLDGLGPDPGKSSKRSGRRSKSGHLLFDFAALFFLALDVDVPADQLAGEPNVLTLFTNGK